MAKKIDKNKKYVLFDTNIISHAATPILRDQIINLFTEVFKAGLLMAYSDILYSEILNTASVEKDQGFFDDLNGIPRFYVKKPTCVLAGRLGTFYKDSGAASHQISLGDRILAATAAFSGSLVMTTNAKDFPAPFFKEITREIITYNNEKGHPVMVVIYFMEPQNDFIGEYHKNRCRPFLEKIVRKIEHQKYLNSEKKDSSK